MLKHDSIPELRAQLKQWRVAGESLALVPTMGNLHHGHLRLVEVARQNADRVVVSIFVNPLQFAPGADFDAYPRTLIEDLDKLMPFAVDAVFIPDVNAMYVDTMGTSTKVSVPELSDMLCGEFRPRHFEGVTTIVAKLFNIVQPDVAVFGEKDYQQLVIIKRMVADLNFAVDVFGVETIRESGGLAMSSRNQYLSEEQRLQASHLYKVLVDIVLKVKSLKSKNTLSISDMRQMEQQSLLRLSEYGFRPEYLTICDASTLSPATAATETMRVLVAAWLGEARLIDNLPV